MKKPPRILAGIVVVAVLIIFINSCVGQEQISRENYAKTKVGFAGVPTSNFSGAKGAVTVLVKSPLSTSELQSALETAKSLELGLVGRAESRRQFQKDAYNINFVRLRTIIDDYFSVNEIVNDPEYIGAFRDVSDAAIEKYNETANCLDDCVLGPGDYDFYIVHGSLTRLYKVHVPLGYDFNRSSPVIIAFHGGGGNAETSVDYFQLNEKSDKEGFIAVYPEGTGPLVKGNVFGTWNAGRCCPPAMDNNVDDVEFIEFMLDELENNFNIDENRIYATGMSNGAQMCYRLACELADKIAAIAPCCSIGTFDNCTPSRPVPVIHFQGVEDPCSFYDGGQCGTCMAEFFNELGIPVTPRPWDCIPVPSYADKWRKRNGCSNQTKITLQTGNATCITYQECPDNAEITICSIAGMGHTWPGSTEYSAEACKTRPNGYVCKLWKETVGALSQDINANDAMWEFFKRHPLKCGNGVCEEGETVANCQEDCEKTFKVKSITTIKEYGKSLDWSHAKNLIAFGKHGQDGYYDVYVMEPDGSGEQCLTCDKEGCPQKHNGNPAWHPLGDYIVFTVEKRDDSEEYKEWAIPGTGFNCDLWMTTSDGENFHQLTDYPITHPWKAIIHPQFSHSGKKLFWAERIERGESFSGGWVLKIADFVIDGKEPHLENISIYEPGGWSCFYESHAFSKDDKSILFSGNLKSGQPPFGLDIYELNLETNQFKRLTETPNEWDEHAHYSPDGKKIAWMSSTGFDIDWGDISGHNWQKYLVTELWIMDADGSNRQRLTYFNVPGHPEYMKGKRCVVSDSTWSPDGKKIAALVAYESFLGLKSKIVMIEVEYGDEKPVCGNGICEPGETVENCPEDCEKTFKVKSITTIKENGGRVDWSHSENNLITFDKEDSDGYFDVYIMKPDGSGEQCLTCDKSELPKHHMGQPAWHPSGKYIVFQAVDPELKIYPPAQRAIGDIVTNPGGGVNNNLWLMNSEATKFWQLTNVGDGLGVLHPHFSKDGSMLTWAEKISWRGYKWGQWVIKIADFKISSNNEPEISNIRTCQPENLKFYETHGFSPDGTKLIFSGLEQDEGDEGMDIYIMDISSGDCSNAQILTDDSIDQWDEHSPISPDGSKIVWMSSMGIDQGVEQFKFKADLWIMDIDGSNKQRLTYFNDPIASEYIPGGVAVSDSSWNNDGNKLAAFLIDRSGKDEHSIVMIEFENGDKKPVCGNGICEEGETIENCPEDCDDTVLPTITIISPHNRTYNTDSVNLNYSIDEPTAWVGYSLDGAANVSIAGNTTLINLADGLHFVCIYANDLAGNMNSSTVWFSVIASFDTGTGAYPSIFGAHNGTITPNQNIEVQKLYTYSCAGTGGHTEYARIWNKTWAGAEAYWEGYQEDWYNVTFNQSFRLVANETYNYTLKTGSYPQIIHEHEFNATGGEITCTEFIDANGERYYDWIPAFRLGR